MPRSDPTSSNSRAEGTRAEPEAEFLARGGPERPRIWLLDGFNVLHASMFGDRDRSKWWAEEHRERLIARVCGFTLQAEEIWIAFDGEREADERQLRTAAGAPVYLIFAPSADDWLVKRARSLQRAETAESSGGVAVVTRDKRVAGRSGHAGAEIVSPAGFLELCGEV